MRKVGDDPNGGGSLTVIDIGTMLNQRFLLEKELGRGGMGAVYSASDELLQRKVAIKLLKEQSGEEVGKRLRLEAQIAARLLHDYVVRIYDFGQAEGSYFLVMEEVQGSSYLKRWRKLVLAERLRILAQVAEALDYAHHQGVIHRDVKPANVLVTANDVPKLSDFGLSMIGEQGDQTGVVRGTPNYMSPEQTRGGRLDYRTDLYSLGVMLYESATGTQPFSGSSIAIMSQHFTAVPEPPRSRNRLISPELEALIVSLLAKRPDERPGSGAIAAQALKQEIERIHEREGPDVDTATAGTGTSTISATTPAVIAPTAASVHQAVNGPSTGKVSVALPAMAATGLISESTQTNAPTPAPAPHGGHASAVPLVLATVGSTGGVTALIRSPWPAGCSR